MKLYIDGVPPRKEESWWRKKFVLQPGDIWEHRINEWGVWDQDAIGRWVWDGKNWNQVPAS